MAIVGIFHITGSFTLTGRGLLAIGDLTEGKVKVGNFLTFKVDEQTVTLKITGLGMGRSVGRETDYVGLLLTYQDENERMRFEKIQLDEQDAEVSDI